MRICEPCRAKRNYPIPPITATAQGMCNFCGTRGKVFLFSQGTEGVHYEGEIVTKILALASQAIEHGEREIAAILNCVARTAQLRRTHQLVVLLGDFLEGTLKETERGHDETIEVNGKEN